MAASSPDEKLILGRAIAQKCGIPLLVYDAHTMVNMHENVGELNFDTIFAQADALHGPCIIMLDKFEAFFKKYDNDPTILAQLWTLLDQYKDRPIFFIATINNLLGMPEPIKDRFINYMVDIGLPYENQRRAIISYYMCRREKVEFARDVDVRELARKTEGFTHLQLKSLILIAGELAFCSLFPCDRETPKRGQIIEVTMDNCLLALIDMQDAEICRKKHDKFIEESSFEYQAKQFGLKLLKNIALQLIREKLGSIKWRK